MPSDDPRDYGAYLARFDREVGPLAVGVYGKFAGQLVKKLTADEHTALAKELAELDRSYQEMILGGHTVSNSLCRLLRQRAAELCVPSPEMRARE